MSTGIKIAIDGVVHDILRIERVQEQGVNVVLFEVLTPIVNAPDFVVAVWHAVPASWFDHRSASFDFRRRGHHLYSWDISNA